LVKSLHVRHVENNLMQVAVLPWRYVAEMGTAKLVTHHRLNIYASSCYLGAMSRRWAPLSCLGPNREYWTFERM